MGRGSAVGGCRSSSHRQFKDKAKTRVDDLQGMFTDLQLARKESRADDVALIEEQVNQVLREWKAELNDPTPASSLGSHDLASEIRRLLGKDQDSHEQDDATSKFTELPLPQQLNEPGPDAGGIDEGTATTFYPEDFYSNQAQPELLFLNPDQYQSILPTETDIFSVNCHEGTAQTDFQHFNWHPSEQSFGFDASEPNGGIGVPHTSDLHQPICPPATACLRPKCALWDCQRSTAGTEWFQDYCSDYHFTLALNEGQPLNTPVIRPGGIEVKDGPLFAALSAKIQGKNVGIPEREGAAFQQSPWNAHDVFDLLLCERETLREWLFFDKPRRAFESGSRKQRSLPDYKGRGWHESRKQVVKEVGGSKRSYYMDPQPSDKFEWHLYEYEMSDCDVCALYRLEYKLVDAKKSAKAKVKSDPVVDLQQQMGRLNAETSVDNKRNVKGRARANQKDNSKNICLSPDMAHQENAQNVYHIPNQMLAINDNAAYGPSRTIDNEQAT